jgi:hypothetical protein
MVVKPINGALSGVMSGTISTQVLSPATAIAVVMTVRARRARLVTRC